MKHKQIKKRTSQSYLINSFVTFLHSVNVFLHYLPMFGKYGIGFFITPFTLTSKCRCGPVDSPVEPLRAITSPLFTSCPTLTKSLVL